MLGNLLRKNSPYNGFYAKSSSLLDDGFTSPMHSNTTITGDISEINEKDKMIDSHDYDEQFGSPLPPSTCTPPILDHVSDSLKYKLFASRSIPFNLAFQSTVLSSYLFRIIVAEETGQVMHRNNYKVVFDYSTAKNAHMDQIRPNELKEYIFGSPIRSTDSSQGNKFRTIPNSELVLITRIFFFDSQTNNRLAVSLCVPNILSPVISEAWSNVSRWFDQCQDIVLAILKENSRLIKSHKKNSYDGYLPSDLKAAFPLECGNMVSLLRNKLIPCLRSTSEIPRLFLYPPTCSNFLESWFKDIFNWIEIKDGPRLNFLPALLAKIICDFQNPVEAQETMRIVIMSGNMVVANKLIFILSGLLEPRYSGKIELECKAGPSVKQHPEQTKGSTKKDAANPEKSTTDPSKYVSAKNGWEIPRASSISSKVSLSSDESLAYVIQPSSLNSASNSIQCLSSSLSSQHGSSYGSWFYKKPNGSQATLNSPTTKSNDQWDRLSAGYSNGTANLPKTASSSSIHQFFTRGPGVTPQPSPSISELDEYPWFAASSSPRTDPSQTLHPQNKRNISSVPLGEVNIKRDCQRLCQTELLEKAFTKICKPNDQTELNEKEFEIIPGDSRHAAFMQIDVDYESVHEERPMELFPRYTTYLPNFNHWFHLQAFPVGPDSGARVVHAMRRDLQVGENTRTLLISLRSREIKELSVMRNEASTFNGSHHSILQKTKKIFNNGKCGNVSTRLINCIAFVNACIKKAMELYEDTEMAPHQRDIEILNVFESLLHYGTDR